VAGGFMGAQLEQTPTNSASTSNGNKFMLGKRSRDGLGDVHLL
jgi:hypothetical protein